MVVDGYEGPNFRSQVMVAISRPHSLVCVVVASLRLICLTHQAHITSAYLPDQICTALGLAGIYMLLRTIVARELFANKGPRCFLSYRYPLSTKLCPHLGKYALIIKVFISASITDERVQSTILINRGASI